jgi:hypothetical protein
MASIGYIRSLLNALDADLKKLLALAFEESVTRNELGDNTKATNFSWYKVSSTTHATANTEFSIAHGLDHVPSKVIPVLDLSQVGSQIVTLTVARAPDIRRVYLSSPSTGAVFTAYVE